MQHLVGGCEVSVIGFDPPKEILSRFDFLVEPCVVEQTGDHTDWLVHFKNENTGLEWSDVLYEVGHLFHEGARIEWDMVLELGAHEELFAETKYVRKVRVSGGTDYDVLAAVNMIVHEPAV